MSLLSRFVMAALVASLLVLARPGQAAMTVQLGPASTGGGGPNPISIPPVNPFDYELVWVTDKQKEWSFSIFPGLFYGQRIKAGNGSYLSMGGGLVINLHGIGPGVYTAFGYQMCSFACFNVEYKQAIGLTATKLLNPYAVRLGVTFFQ